MIKKYLSKSLQSKCETGNKSVQSKDEKKRLVDPANTEQLHICRREGWIASLLATLI